jgi:hypothetical protein
LRDYQNQCTVHLTKKSMLCRSSVDMRSDSFPFMMICHNRFNQPILCSFSLPLFSISKGGGFCNALFMPF